MQRLAQLLVTQLDRAHLRRQPLRELVLVATRRFTESEPRPHLRPVVLDRAAGPAIRLQQRGIDLHLLGRIRHRGSR